MPMPDQSLEFQFDRRFTELETRFAFQEQALTEMSDALAASRGGERRSNHQLLAAGAGRPQATARPALFRSRRPNRRRRITESMPVDEQFPPRPIARPGLQARAKPERQPTQAEARAEPAGRGRRAADAGARRPSGRTTSRDAAARTDRPDRDGACPLPHRQDRSEEIDLAKAYAIRAQQEKDERIEAERLKQEAGAASAAKPRRSLPSCSRTRP